MPYLTPDTPPDDLMVCRRLKIPAHSDWLALVDGALSELTKAYNFEQFGTASVDDVTQFFEQFYINYIDSTDFCMIGSIFPYVTTLPPAHCLVCDGATYDRVDYPELYAKLDGAFIVDADTFTVPDLRGHTVIGAGDGGADFTNRTVGERGGEEAHQLSETELASHTHTDTGHSHTYTPPGSTFLFVAPGEAPGALVNLLPGLTGSAAANIQNTGSDAPHNNMQPFVALNYCVVAL